MPSIRSKLSFPLKSCQNGSKGNEQFTLIFPLLKWIDWFPREPKLTGFQCQRQQLGFWLVGTKLFFQNEMPTKIQSAGQLLLAFAAIVERTLEKQTWLVNSWPIREKQTWLVNSWPIREKQTWLVKSWPIRNKQTRLVNSWPIRVKHTWLVNSWPIRNKKTWLVNRWGDQSERSRQDW